MVIDSENIKEIENFLENNSKTIPNELKGECNLIWNKLNLLKGIKKTHFNFNLSTFITSSNDTNVSLAIKSRCLCIKIKPFKSPKDYGDLICNCLINAGIAENNIVEISKKVGIAFHKLKEEKKYILKNYILNSVNLVNFSKLIISEQPIEENKLAQIIEFSFFSSFKENSKYKCIDSFKKYLNEENDFEIIPIRNIKRSH